MKKKSHSEETPPEAKHDAAEAAAGGGDVAEPQGSGGEPEGSELERTKAQLARALADLANIRKRHAREKEEARKRALEGLAAELLPVLDNFHLALGASRGADEKADPNAIVEGLMMVRSLLEGVLERHGLSEIPSTGAAFDPNVHEAVGVDPDAAVKPGHVSQVMLRGYRMGDRVIRAARVLVAPSSDQGPPAEDRDGGGRDPDSH